MVGLVGKSIFEDFASAKRPVGESLRGVKKRVGAGVRADFGGPAVLRGRFLDIPHRRRGAGLKAEIGDFRGSAVGLPVSRRKRPAQAACRTFFGRQGTQAFKKFDLE